MPQQSKIEDGHHCSSCSNPAITYIRYSGAYLCKAHLNEFLKTRVKRELRKQGKMADGAKLAVAVSGGKDSLTMLNLLAEIYKSHRNLELFAISIDEGIHPYRTESLKLAAKACKSLDIEHHILSFKTKFGYSLDEIVRKNVPELLPCSFCGVLRRTLLNSLARNEKATKLATGHNLDDNSQSILMNICKGDFNKLFRLGPHRIVKPGLVPRILPLRTIPEKEIYLYTILNDIDAHTGECPYAHFAQRGLYRKILSQLEYHQPGTRHSIINIYDQLYEGIESNLVTSPISSCSECGEPSTGSLCKSCQMLKMVEDAAI
jgi:uncharacterized protein (TIGR00269 family)